MVQSFYFYISKIKLNFIQNSDTLLAWIQLWWYEYKLKCSTDVCFIKLWLQCIECEVLQLALKHFMLWWGLCGNKIYFTPNQLSSRHKYISHFPREQLQRHSIWHSHSYVRMRISSFCLCSDSQIQIDSWSESCTR